MSDAGQTRSNERRPIAHFYGEGTVSAPALPARLNPFIGGEWTDASGSARVEVIEPFTARTVAAVPIAGEPNVRAAVESVLAQASRSATISPSERAIALERLGGAIDANADQLAALESQTTGRPIARTIHDDLPLIAQALRHFASIADPLHRLHPQGSWPRAGTVIVPVTTRQPLLSCIDVLAPACACGTPVIFLVDAQAALPVLRLAELISDIGGSGSIVSIIPVAANEGMNLAATCASAGAMLFPPPAGAGVIRPALIFLDCDIDQAVEGIVQQAFTPNLPGEELGSHVFVEEGVEREFIDRLRERLAATRVGNPLDVNVELGPAPTKECLGGFEQRIARAEAAGTPVTRFATDAPQTHDFVAAPALLAPARPDQLIARQSLGGPALVLITFRTPDEALSKLKATSAALGATTIWTGKAGKAPALARRISSRFIYCNMRDRLTVGLTTGVAALPFASANRPALLIDNDATISVEVIGSEIIAPFAPLSRYRQIVQALGV